jgi:hypothetical protein
MDDKLKGRGEITNNVSTVIKLPKDFNITNAVIQITPYVNQNNRVPSTFITTDFNENNEFTVLGQNGLFYWLVIT